MARDRNTLGYNFNVGGPTPTVRRRPLTYGDTGETESGDTGGVAGDRGRGGTGGNIGGTGTSTGGTGDLSWVNLGEDTGDTGGSTGGTGVAGDRGTGSTGTGTGGTTLGGRGGNTTGTTATSPVSTTLEGLLADFFKAYPNGVYRTGPATGPTLGTTRPGGGTTSSFEPITSHFEPITYTKPGLSDYSSYFTFPKYDYDKPVTPYSGLASNLDTYHTGALAGSTNYWPTMWKNIDYLNQYGLPNSQELEKEQTNLGYGGLAGDVLGGKDKKYGVSDLLSQVYNEGLPGQRSIENIIPAGSKRGEWMSQKGEDILGNLSTKSLPNLTGESAKAVSTLNKLSKGTLTPSESRKLRTGSSNILNSINVDKSYNTSTDYLSDLLKGKDTDTSKYVEPAGDTLLDYTNAQLPTSVGKTQLAKSAGFLDALAEGYEPPVQKTTSKALTDLIEGGGVSDKYTDAYYRHIYKPAEEKYLGTLNKLGGGVSNLGSGEMAELLRRNAQDYTDALTIAGYGALPKFTEQGTKLGTSEYGQKLDTAEALDKSATGKTTTGLKLAAGLSDLATGLRGSKVTGAGTLGTVAEKKATTKLNIADAKRVLGHEAFKEGADLASGYGELGKEQFYRPSTVAEQYLKGGDLSTKNAISGFRAVGDTAWPYVNTGATLGTNLLSQATDKYAARSKYGLENLKTINDIAGTASTGAGKFLTGQQDYSLGQGKNEYDYGLGKGKIGEGLYGIDTRYASDIYGTGARYASDIYGTGARYASDIYGTNTKYDETMLNALKDLDLGKLDSNTRKYIADQARIASENIAKTGAIGTGVGSVLSNQKLWDLLARLFKIPNTRTGATINIGGGGGATGGTGTYGGWDPWDPVIWNYR